MDDIFLSKHFRLSEFLNSSTAVVKGIDNTIPADQYDMIVGNLTRLSVNVLEFVRDFSNCPIMISSGYRCRRLNSAVHGAYNSQHTRGLAADIYPLSAKPDARTIGEIFLWMFNALDVDQCIYYPDKRFIHVSYVNDTANRRDFKYRCTIGMATRADVYVPLRTAEDVERMLSAE